LSFLVGEEDLPHIGRLAAASPSSAPGWAPGASGALAAIARGLRKRLTAGRV